MLDAATARAQARRCRSRRVGARCLVANMGEMMAADAKAGFRIVEDDLSGNEIQEILRLHAEGMLSNSPKDACHFLDLSGLQDPSVTLWSAWEGDQLAGCGAVKELDTSHGEVKSMRTATGYLGRGVGRVVLEHIITAARQRSYRRLSLETGTGDSFAAAVHLYESSGSQRCEPFGSYEDNDFSQFFMLSL